MAQWLRNLTRSNEVSGLIPGLTQWVKDPTLLWLWHRLVAIVLIRPLAWEPPYAIGVALEKAKRPKKKTKKKKKGMLVQFSVSQNFFYHRTDVGATLYTAAP